RGADEPRGGRRVEPGPAREPASAAGPLLLPRGLTRSRRRAHKPRTAPRHAPGRPAVGRTPQALPLSPDNRPTASMVLNRTLVAVRSSGGEPRVGKACLAGKALARQRPGA